MSEGGGKRLDRFAGKGWKAKARPVSIAGMKIVRALLVLMLALLFALFAVASFMSWFVLAWVFGFIFAAFSLSSLGAALRIVMQRNA